MNSLTDVTTFMLWLHRTGRYGDLYPLDDGTFIWKRVGDRSELYLCDNGHILPLVVQRMS